MFCFSLIVLDFVIQLYFYNKIIIIIIIIFTWTVLPEHDADRTKIDSWQHVYFLWGEEEANFKLKIVLTTMSKWLLFLVLFRQIYQITRCIDYTCTKPIVSTLELVGRNSVLNVFKKAEFWRRHTTLVVINWKTQKIVWVISALLLSGDIHLNPGPVEVPCVICSSSVDAQGIQCYLCDMWCHPECAHLDQEEYDRLGVSDEQCCSGYVLNVACLHQCLVPQKYPWDIKIIHYNIQSLINVIDEQRVTYENKPFDLICLFETWCKPSHLDTSLAIQF